MELKGLQLLPILLVLWTTAGLVISYTLRYLRIYTGVSLLGSYFSRSPFLIVTMVVCAILSSVMALIVYKYQMLHPETRDSKHNTWYQRGLLAIGLTACLGLTITVLTLTKSLLMTNLLAVTITYTFGAIYILFQAICLLSTSCSSRHVNGVRLVLAVTFNIALLLFYSISMMLLFSVCKNLRCSLIFDQVLKYLWYIAFGCFALSVLTFYQDFQTLQLTISKKEITIKFRESIPESII